MKTSEVMLPCIFMMTLKGLTSYLSFWEHFKIYGQCVNELCVESLSLNVKIYVALSNCVTSFHIFL